MHPKKSQYKRPYSKNLRPQHLASVTSAVNAALGASVGIASSAALASSAASRISAA